MKKNYVKNNDFKRPYFIEDPKVKTGSADWRNYKNRVMTKGIFARPAISNLRSKPITTLFLPRIFRHNCTISTAVSGIDWNKKCAIGLPVQWNLRGYGGILHPSLQTIGKEKVSVPNYFYKILLDYSNGQYRMIAFFVPSKKSDKPLYDFVVSVDTVEKITGIDFFPKLDDESKTIWRKPAITRLGVLIKNYHSFTLLASILIKIKSRMVKPQSPEPP